MARRCLQAFRDDGNAHYRLKLTPLAPRFLPAELQPGLSRRYKHQRRTRMLLYKRQSNGKNMLLIIRQKPFENSSPSSIQTGLQFLL